jgi:putative chitobiose transport system permease protein
MAAVTHNSSSAFAKPGSFLGYVYLALPLSLLLVFFLLPLLWAFWMSCFDYTTLWAPRFIGFDHYSALLHSAEFWQCLKNTVILAFLVVPAMIILPLPIAVLVNQSLRGMALFRAVLYFPVLISAVVAAILWKWLYAEKGLINFALTSVGLPAVDWLVSPDWVLLAIAIMIIWKGLGYYMMLYLASLQSVNQELYEAATVDGANAVQKHWAVTFPHLKSTMALVAIVSTIGLLKAFGEIYVLTKGGPVGSSMTLVYQIYETAFGLLDPGRASALGFVLMLILLALSSLQIYGVYLKDEARSRDASA